jgi:hypothetical protein
LVSCGFEPDGPSPFAAEAQVLGHKEESMHTQAKKEEVPSLLYKYRSLEDSAIDFTKKFVVDAELWFASCTAFNDPFDCRVRFGLSGNKKQRARFVTRVMNELHPDMPRKQIKRGIRELEQMKWKFPPEAKRQAETDYYADVERMNGIFCVSEVPDSILMWSHYADSHRGICVGIVPQEDPGILMNAQRVRYENEYPVVNPMNESPMTLFLKTVAVKAPQWAYEHEWRILNNKPNSIQKCRNTSIQEVILGACIEPEKRKAVEEWVAGLDHEVELRTASLDPERYELRFT